MPDIIGKTPQQAQIEISRVLDRYLRRNGRNVADQIVEKAGVTKQDFDWMLHPSAGPKPAYGKAESIVKQLELRGGHESYILQLVGLGYSDSEPIPAT